MPMRKALGLFKRFAKSCLVRPIPNVNIININERGKNTSIIICIYYMCNLKTQNHMTLAGSTNSQIVIIKNRYLLEDILFWVLVFAMSL